MKYVYVVYVAMRLYWKDSDNQGKSEKASPRKGCFGMLQPRGSRTGCESVLGGVGNGQTVSESFQQSGRQH